MGTHENLKPRAVPGDRVLPSMRFLTYVKVRQIVF